MASCFLLVLRRGSAIGLLRSTPRKFARLHSTMSRLLIEEPKYSWLKELGLQSDNLGVFSGTWSGHGQVNTPLSTLTLLITRSAGDST